MDGEVNMTEDKYSDEKLKFRKQVLSILMKNFNNNKVIYACADDWCNNQVTTNGLVKYCNAYYNNFNK